METVNMEITMKVTGKEGFEASVKYLNTTLETVRRVQNAITQGLIGLNEEDKE